MNKPQKSIDEVGEHLWHCGLRLPPTSTTLTRKLLYATPYIWVELFGSLYLGRIWDLVPLSLIETKFVLIERAVAFEDDTLGGLDFYDLHVCRIG